MRKFYNTLLLIFFTGLKIVAQHTIDSSLYASPLESSRQKPFSLNAAYTADFVADLSGKNQHYLGMLGNLDVKVTFDTEKANVWRGGTFHLYAIVNHGAHPTTNIIGDLQGISNIEAPNRSYLYELWYEQKIGPLALLVGQHDLNSDLVNTKNGISLVNGSFGFQPDVSGNTPISNFSFTTLGLRLKWNIREKFMLQTALYKGNPGDKRTNPYGINWHISRGEGYLAITELQYFVYTNKKITGTLKMGAWYHSQLFCQVLDSTIRKKGNNGLFFIADQHLFTEKSNLSNGLGGFIQLGMAPSAINRISFYSGIGLAYTGLFPGRDYDVVSLGLANAEMSTLLVMASEGVLARNENVIELTYKAQLSPHLTIQPDLQYIINPGSRTSSPNSLFALMRILMTL
jgi:porin